MLQAAEASLAQDTHGPRPALQDEIDAALQDGTTPISRLLRLISALDPTVGANENLRLQLRARIGAPRSV